MELIQRPRRNRRSKAQRDLVSETTVRRSDLIYPIFIVDGSGQKQPISSLPGQYRWSVDQLPALCEKALNLGVCSLAPFPCLEDSKKNSGATEAYADDNLMVQAIKTVKKKFPEITLITDVALDPYSSDGHDGLVREGRILNDETVQLLCRMSQLFASVGADFMGPSDMMDGRVGAIRQALDQSGYTDTGIISYSAKFASSYYGPFREALDSAPKSGDKLTYQLDPRNTKVALAEAQYDDIEGADMIMVKPALPYLDILAKLHEVTLKPLAAYNVSGEYAMIKAAAQNQWIEEPKVIGETLVSIKRAGAQCIFTYFALDPFVLPNE